MRGKIGFENILGIALALVCTLIGLTSMIGLSPSVSRIKAQIAEKKTASETEEELCVPVSGMNVTISEYVQSNEENAISFLSTTVLLSSEDENKYMNDDGSSTGRFIVCTANDGAVIYSAPFEEGQEDTVYEKGTLETYGVATLISEEGGWCHVLSGDVYGYVKAEDFAFGSEAEELDEYTYKDIVTINDDGTYLYELANSRSTVLCVLSEGLSFEVVSAGTNYIRIDIEDIGKGLVKTDAVTQETVRRTAVSAEDALEEASLIEEGIAAAEELGPSFIWPLPYPYYSNYITSYYGYRYDSVGSTYHRGIDIHAASGTSVYAVMDGTVAETGYGSAEGYYIVLDHGDGLYTLYLHLKTSALYSEGESVKQGDTIGYVGSTGLSSGNHLHIGVGIGGYDQDDLVDPSDYLGI